MSWELQESRFDAMMLQSQWQEDLRSRMARADASASFDRTTFIDQALRVLPESLAEHAQAAAADDASRLDSEVYQSILAIAAIKALAEGTEELQNAALGILGEITPREPGHPLLEGVLETLVGCSLDSGVPTSVRYRAAGLIDHLVTYLSIV